MSSIASDFLSIIASAVGADLGGIAAVWLVVAFIPGFDIVPIEFAIYAFADALSAPTAMTVKMMFFGFIRSSLNPHYSFATAKRARDVQLGIMPQEKVEFPWPIHPDVNSGLSALQGQVCPLSGHAPLQIFNLKKTVPDSSLTDTECVQLLWMAVSRSEADWQLLGSDCVGLIGSKWGVSGPSVLGIDGLSAGRLELGGSPIRPVSGAKAK